MKRIAFALAIALMGCGAKSPIAPSTAQADYTPTPAVAHYVPQHHNIPATFAGQESGPIVYLCATQPRQYSKDGITRTEEDHYLQYAPCPTEPIE